MTQTSKISIILLAVFIKQFTWATFVPLWQTPDEQAHFSQVQNFAELSSNTPFPVNLSREIWLSEVALGTDRDPAGNNKYTYHPEFNITYSKSLVGLYEESIANLPKSNRTNYVKNEGTWYPPAYYFLAAGFYKVLNEGSLFDRVFFVRLASVLTLVGLAFVAHKIGRLLFVNDSRPLILAVLVGFTPMVTFVHAGVSSDALFNLLFSIFLWRCLSLIKNGLKLSEIFWLALVIIISFWTKPQANIMVFIVGPLLITLFILQKNKDWKPFLAILAVFALALVGIVIRIRAGVSIFPETEYGPPLSFAPFKILEHLEFTAQHTYREVLPWFWGVFRWLSLGLPETLRKVTNFLTVISFLGFGYYLFSEARKKTLSKQFWMLIFLAFSTIVYFSALSAFDFGFRQSHGYSFGIQGRYFFPVIIPFMVVFLVGLRRLSTLLAIFMIIFNLIIFFWLSGSYYQFSYPLFFLQASQYKPFWLKFPINFVLIFGYIICSVGLIGIILKRDKSSN